MTGRVKFVTVQPIVNRSSEWTKTKTAEAFLSSVRIQCEDSEGELLISHINRLLDVPVFSDDDKSNNMLYITLSHSPDLFNAKLIHVPRHMDLKHPCAVFLVAHALRDAGMVTLELAKHVYCVVTPTCDKFPVFWYNMLIMFVDDLQRTLSVSAALMSEDGLAKHTCSMPQLTCCLDNTYYSEDDDWPKRKEEATPNTPSVCSVTLAHTHKRGEGQQRYISEPAVLEVAADVCTYG
jgi:hypothetical protein